MTTPSPRHPDPGAPGTAEGEVCQLHQTRRFRVLGFDFAVRSTDPALARYLDQLLDHLAVTGNAEHLYCFEDHGAGQRPRIVLSLDGKRLRATSEPAVGLGHLLWDLNRKVIEVAGPGHLLLHAAGAERDGGLVILPGPAEAGKSTLAAGLVHAGLNYVTDEVIAIDLDDLLVHPYAKPLDIDAGSWPVLAHLAPPAEPELAEYLAEQWHLAPTSVGAGGVASPAPVRLIVAPTYRPHAATELTPMARSEAVLAMAEQAFNFGQHGRRALSALATLVRPCRCYRLTVSDLDQACALVMQELDRSIPVLPEGASP